MRILAIESATERPGVALIDAGVCVAERAAGRDGTRSETLLPAIDALLAAAGLSATDLDAFAIGIGPGSFTGLRVGLATLKGLAFGLDRPAVAVPTLEALASTAGDPRPGPVAAVLDARRGEYYGAVYPAGAGSEPALPEGLYRPDALAAALPAGCLLVGDVAGPGSDALAPLIAAGARVHAGGGPCAGRVGVLGARRLAAGEGGLAAELVPRYVRRAEAEVLRLGRATEGP